MSQRCLRLVCRNLFGPQFHADIGPAQARGDDAAHRSSGEGVQDGAALRAEPAISDFAQHRVKDRGAGRCGGIGRLIVIRQEFFGRKFAAKFRLLRTLLRVELRIAGGVRRHQNAAIGLFADLVLAPHQILPESAREGLSHFPPPCSHLIEVVSADCPNCPAPPRRFWARPSLHFLKWRLPQPDPPTHRVRVAPRR